MRHLVFVSALIILIGAALALARLHAQAAPTEPTPESYGLTDASMMSLIPDRALSQELELRIDQARRQLRQLDVHIESSSESPRNSSKIRSRDRLRDELRRIDDLRGRLRHQAEVVRLSGENEASVNLIDELQAQIVILDELMVD